MASDLCPGTSNQYLIYKFGLTTDMADRRGDLNLPAQYGRIEVRWHFHDPNGTDDHEMVRLHPIQEMMA
ncbi:hypothetical protein BBO99_00001036 [Phytophthora kernoviae]|uniref:Uncharacterized protein n=2 Tax=Phytophthora kernoviae TaxID=325452 RepID=A0A3R7HN48_9STRA|nr:hypothetical protein G195_008170 [Phytophthora kernoviae 00238/432]KAG2519788.1 hypothetical protein JM16_006982 [Phytophthora kernoviae]KAG2533430.1 hypothetical protein JM18_000337 [Phytophthora kernoviae]RLN06698.1 hypothetical protein BBI17_001007 [Phytophthora kernoviae]RLN84788.1 hypothetical protein BBO99_00001036 [Phytophthora kernoviae]